MQLASLLQNKKIIKQENFNSPILSPPPSAANGEEKESILLGNPVNKVVRLIPVLIELDPESLSTDESIEDVKRLLNAGLRKRREKRD